MSEVSNTEIADSIDWLCIYWRDLRFTEVDTSFVEHTGQVRLKGRRRTGDLLVDVVLSIAEVHVRPNGTDSGYLTYLHGPPVEIQSESLDSTGGTRIPRLRRRAKLDHKAAHDHHHPDPDRTSD
jgi:hypothetical protein